MIKPKTSEYDIGCDVYGRPVTLTYHKNYSGKELYELKIEAMNQRDDTQKIIGLSAENLKAMASIPLGGDE